METKYLSAAETAKVVRKILKEKFPGTKFSVRSESYSMGSSVNVNWFDGPTEKAVNNAVGFLAGSDFDGSIDLKVSVHHWILPDGKIVLASLQGTEGSGGYIQGFEKEKPHPEAIRVNFADHIFLHRRYSKQFVTAVMWVVSKKFGGALPKIEGSDESGYYINARADMRMERTYNIVMANSVLRHGKNLVCYDSVYRDIIHSKK